MRQTKVYVNKQIKVYLQSDEKKIKVYTCSDEVTERKNEKKDKQVYIGASLLEKLPLGF